MKKLILIAILIASLVAASTFNIALAKPENPPANDIAKVVFVHHKAPAKPDTSPAKGPKNPGYKLAGVKWADSSLPVSYLINSGSAPAGVNITSAAAINEIQAAFTKWDSNTSKALYSYAGTTAIAEANLDGSNTVSWVPISDTGTIAVTTYWYFIFTHTLIEFDMELNSNFPWGIDTDGEGTGYTLAGAMDIRNIVTHEAGHTLVLDDLYNKRDSAMTMYGYSTWGEVKKISLESGDLAGLHSLYGS